MALSTRIFRRRPPGIERATETGSRLSAGGVVRGDGGAAGTAARAGAISARRPPGRNGLPAIKACRVLAVVVRAPVTRSDESHSEARKGPHCGPPRDVRRPTGGGVAGVRGLDGRGADRDAGASGAVAAPARSAPGPGFDHSAGVTYLG